jgi:hypothetical protein
LEVSSRKIVPETLSWKNPSQKGGGGGCARYNFHGNHSIVTKSKGRTGIVVHTCNPCTWEAEAGRSQVPGQPGLWSKTVSKIRAMHQKKEVKNP